jgi:hypothetical protein
MSPHDAAKTLGYEELPKLSLRRRDKVRTLGYNQLPNGELNPLGFGAPLSLAPQPARPVNTLKPVRVPPRPRPSRSKLEAFPLVSLRRAADVPEPSFEPPASSPSPLAEAASWPLVRRRQTGITNAWFAAPPPCDEAAFIVPTQEAPSRVRRIAVRVLASLSLVAGLAGVVYVGVNNPAALSAVAGWATLGQLK